jgi:hypothetical protein
MTDEGAREHLASATVDARRIAFVAVSVLIFLAASMGILAFVFFTVAPGNRVPTPREFPEPRLQTHPFADLRKYLAKQRGELNRYRWAESDHTLVAIPIERAMEIIAQRGPNGYDPIESPQAASPPQPWGSP